MTVTSLGVRNEYTATAGQTIFTYTFLIFGSSDLNVYITPSGQTANDSTDITTAYTITSGIENPGGGAITLDSGATSGDLVTIVSNIVNSRTTDYQNSGDFEPDTVNDDFDRTLSLVKQQLDSTSRTLSFPQSLQNASSLTLPLPEAGLFVVWNGSEDGLVNSGAPGSVINSDLTGTTVQMVANASLSSGDIIITTGYSVAGDGGDNTFLVRLVTGATADGGALIKGVGNPAIEFVGLFPSNIKNIRQYGQTTSLTFNVPTDFATLQLALDEFSAFEFPEDEKGVVNIESAHVLTAGFRVENVDLSAVTITSVDATVAVTAGFTFVSNTDLSSDVPRSAGICFLGVSAFMPVWDILVNLAARTLTVTGYEIDYGSSGIINPTKGVINTQVGSNLRVTTASRLQAAQSVFTGAAGDNVGITLSATANFQDADLSGAVTNACLDVSRGSYVHCKGANLTSSGTNTEGLYVRRSTVSAEGVNLTNNALGIRAANKSDVGANGSTFDGCTNDVKAEQGSEIDVSGSLKSAAALDPSDSIVPNGAGGTMLLRMFNTEQFGCEVRDSDFNDEEETATGTFTVSGFIPATLIDSSGGAVTGTLGTNTIIPTGFIKTIVMTNASNSSTVSVTNHETSDPEVITFAAVDDTAILLFTGSEWITIKLSGATV